VTVAVSTHRYKCPCVWVVGLLGLMDNCSVPPSSNWKKLEHELEQPFKSKSGKELWQPTTSKECSDGQGLSVGTGVGTHIQLLLTLRHDWCEVLPVGTGVGTN